MADVDQYEEGIDEGMEEGMDEEMGEEGEAPWDDAFDGDVAALDPNDVRKTPAVNLTY